MAKMVYQNGLPVATGTTGDHTSVRAILRSGAVSKRVDNFGPLLNKETATTYINTEGLERLTVGGFELFVKPSTGFNFSFTSLETTPQEGVHVYYQRIL